MCCRGQGQDRLRVLPPEAEEARRFFRENGFAPAGDGPDAPWEKRIGFDGGSLPEDAGAP